MKFKARIRKVTALAAAGTLAGTLVVTAGAWPNSTSSTTANAATNGATTLTPNPAYQGPEFDGWGTSLVWFANATGDYPEALRQELYDYLFSAEGMNLNVARYNIGGGNSSDAPNYFRQGADVEGWWKANTEDTDKPLSTYDERAAFLEAWDADDPDSYNWDADQTQRWWVEELAKNRDDMVWEAFSNSPPYFMTNSGFATGNFKSSDEQMSTASDAPTKFVKYLTNVTEYMEDTYGIEFNSVDPFNEPCNGYWGTNVPSGQKWPSVGGKVQEGAQICPGTGEGQQQSIIDKLSAELEASSTNALLSANDETHPQRFNQAWAQYSQKTRDQVGQVNVHTYSTGGILQARDVAKASDKPLWMSETGGNYVDSTGFDPLSFSGGINFSQRVISDIRQLEPDAYVFWQEIEDYYNMEKVEKLNWGSVFIDFDCNDDGYSERRLNDAGWTEGEEYPEAAKCKIVTNSKYNALRNFTHYIPQGSHFIATNDSNTTSALTPDGLSVVHVNAGSAEETVSLDLSKFGEITDGATVTPVVTTEANSTDDLTSNSLVEGTPVNVDAKTKSATLTVPAKSVTTFVVDGVSGVSEDADLVSSGDKVQLIGQQSGKALAAGTSGAALANIATSAPEGEDSALTNQQWTFHKISGEYSADALYTVENGEGKFLGATASGTDLRDITADEAAANGETLWLVNTTDGVKISLLNQNLQQVLDVNEQSTAVGAKVGTYGSNGGANQTWTVRTADLQGIVAQNVHTGIGVEAELPTTVTPIYSWGTGEPVPVTWDVPSEYWTKSGTITVTGSGTDVYGNTFDDASLTIDVGAFDLVDSASMTVAVGSSVSAAKAKAPSKVTGRVSGSTSAYDLPVTWDWSSLSDADLSTAGSHEVTGTVAAADNDGSELAAKLVVYVTNGAEQNLLLLDGVTSTSTYAESGRGPNLTHNGNTTEKGWSTWGSGRVYSQDSATYTLPDTYEATSAKVYFYRDGGNVSWAQSIQVQSLVDGQWVDSPAGTVSVVAPASGQIVTEIDLQSITSNQIRFVFNATNYLTVSEVELYGSLPVAADDAQLSALRVGGTNVADFAAGTLTYEAVSKGSAYPVVTAVARDRAGSVEVSQASVDNGGLATVTVTAADGTTQSVYTVQFARQILISDILISGEDLRVGDVATAVVAVDPADATLTYQWLRDGSEISGATEATYVAEAEDVGMELTVRVGATKAEFTEAAAVDSEPVSVRALSSDATLADLTIDGTTVSGFAADQTSYSVTHRGSSMPTVEAVAKDANATVSITQPGEDGLATITVKAEDGSEQVYEVQVELLPNVATVSRIDGADRYETALKLASLTLAEGKPVIVTTGTDYADALTASAAAKKIDGSLVLTSPAKMNDATVKALRNAKPSQIYIVGGESAVSAQVANQMKDIVGAKNFKRVSGNTRYDTSLEVLRTFFVDSDSADNTDNMAGRVAYVATGLSHADALVAAAAAGSLDAPVVLVRGNDAASVSGKLIATMQDAHINEVLVAGGNQAVNSKVFSTLKAKFSDIKRLEGTDRYLTAQAINTDLDDRLGGGSAQALSQVRTVWVATGTDFADGLAASAVAASPDARLVLARPNCLPTASLGAVTSRYPNLESVKLVGGKKALSAGVQSLTVCK